MVNGIYGPIDGIYRWDSKGIYPLVNIQKAIENSPVEIVDLPIQHGDFS